MTHRRSPTSKALHHLDELDVKIIKELRSPGSPQWNVRESFSEISRKLGVDEETVRRRVNMARQHGFLPVWRLRVNPRIVGWESAGLDLEVEDEEKKANAIRQIGLVEGVTEVIDFRGKGLQVALNYANEESLRKNAKRIAGICGTARTALWKSEFPKPKADMKRLDWEIVAALREDARKELEAVATALKVTVRTVQRRLASMTENKAIYLVAAPNVKMVGGLICGFLIFAPDERKKRAADKVALATIPRMGGSETSPDLYSTFGAVCENLSEADAIAANLKALDGVESVRLGIVREFVPVDDWLVNTIESHL